MPKAGGSEWATLWIIDALENNKFPYFSWFDRNNLLFAAPAPLPAGSDIPPGWYSVYHAFDEECDRVYGPSPVVGQTVYGRFGRLLRGTRRAVVRNDLRYSDTFGGSYVVWQLVRTPFKNCTYCYGAAYGPEKLQRFIQCLLSPPMQTTATRRSDTREQSYEEAGAAAPAPPKAPSGLRGRPRKSNRYYNVGDITTEQKAACSVWIPVNEGASTSGMGSSGTRQVTQASCFTWRVPGDPPAPSTLTGPSDPHSSGAGLPGTAPPKPQHETRLAGTVSGVSGVAQTPGDTGQLAPPMRDGSRLPSTSPWIPACFPWGDLPVTGWWPQGASGLPEKVHPPTTGQFDPLSPRWTYTGIPSSQLNPAAPSWIPPHAQAGTFVGEFSQGAPLAPQGLLPQSGQCASAWLPRRETGAEGACGASTEGRAPQGAASERVYPFEPQPPSAPAPGYAKPSCYNWSPLAEPPATRPIRAPVWHPPVGHAVVPEVRTPLWIPWSSGGAPNQGLSHTQGGASATPSAGAPPTPEVAERQEPSSSGIPYVCQGDNMATGYRRVTTSSGALEVEIIDLTGDSDTPSTTVASTPLPVSGPRVFQPTVLYSAPEPAVNPEVSHLPTELERRECVCPGSGERPRVPLVSTYAGDRYAVGGYGPEQSLVPPPLGLPLTLSNLQGEDICTWEEGLGNILSELQEEPSSSTRHATDRRRPRSRSPHGRRTPVSHSGPEKPPSKMFFDPPDSQRVSFVVEIFVYGNLRGTLRREGDAGEAMLCSWPVGDTLGHLCQSFVPELLRIPRLTVPSPEQMEILNRVFEGLGHGFPIFCSMSGIYSRNATQVEGWWFGNPNSRYERILRSFSPRVPQQLFNTARYLATTAAIPQTPLSVNPVTCGTVFFGASPASTENFQNVPLTVKIFIGSIWDSLH
nr:vIRF-4 [Human gammaherpesvirus 8]UQT64642.1 vIRF-4 [Human gammaherpesvirus 8]